MLLERTVKRLVYRVPLKGERYIDDYDGRPFGTIGLATCDFASEYWVIEELT